MFPPGAVVWDSEVGLSIGGIIKLYKYSSGAGGAGLVPPIQSIISRNFS